MRQWLRDVKTDDAYADVLGLLRHPMTHRTAPEALTDAPTWARARQRLSLYRDSFGHPRVRVAYRAREGV